MKLLKLDEDHVTARIPRKQVSCHNVVLRRGTRVGLGARVDQMTGEIELFIHLNSKVGDDAVRCEFNHCVSRSKIPSRFKVPVVAMLRSDPVAFFEGVVSHALARIAVLEIGYIDGSDGGEAKFELELSLPGFYTSGLLKAALAENFIRGIERKPLL